MCVYGALESHRYANAFSFGAMQTMKCQHLLFSGGEIGEGVRARKKSLGVRLALHPFFFLDVPDLSRPFQADHALVLTNMPNTFLFTAKKTASAACICFTKFDEAKMSIARFIRTTSQLPVHWTLFFSLKMLSGSARCQQKSIVLVYLLASSKHQR